MGWKCEKCGPTGQGLPGDDGKTHCPNFDCDLALEYESEQVHIARDKRSFTTGAVPPGRPPGPTANERASIAEGRAIWARVKARIEGNTPPIAPQQNFPEPNQSYDVEETQMSKPKLDKADKYSAANMLKILELAKRGLSQSAIAKEVGCGFSQSQISQVERQNGFDRATLKAHLKTKVESEKKPKKPREKKEPKPKAIPKTIEGEGFTCTISGVVKNKEKDTAEEIKPVTVTLQGEPPKPITEFVGITKDGRQIPIENRDITIADLEGSIPKASPSGTSAFYQPTKLEGIAKETKAIEGVVTALQDLENKDTKARVLDYALRHIFGESVVVEIP